MATPATKTERAEKVIEEAALTFPVVVLLLPVVRFPVVRLPVVRLPVVEMVEVMVMVGRKLDGETDNTPVVVVGLMLEGAGVREGVMVGVTEAVGLTLGTHGAAGVPNSMR
jgi:hypothetical protein